MKTGRNVKSENASCLGARETRVRVAASKRRGCWRKLDGPRHPRLRQYPAASMAAPADQQAAPQGPLQSPPDFAKSSGALVGTGQVPV